MKKTDYDEVNHCCKHCGTLMPNTEIDIANHSQAECLIDKMHRDERKIPFTNSKFRVGEEIEVSFVGKVEEVVRTKNGVFYKVRGDVTFGLFKESELYPLVTPEALDDCGIGDLEYEKQKEEGTKEEER